MTPEQNRNKLEALLPISTIDRIEEEDRSDHGLTSTSRFSLSHLAGDCFREPKNKSEAAAHRFLTDLGCVPFRKGWPDFLVAPNSNDLFAIEVKGPGDCLSAVQIAVLELLATKMDVYVWWIGESGAIIDVEPMGGSLPWSERIGAVAV